MGLFKKKDAAPAAPPETPLPDDAGWRRWSERGFEKFDAGFMGAAVEHWAQAIDRFDGEPRHYQKFHQQMLDRILPELTRRAKLGQILPTHMLSEVDVELYLKHRELQESMLVDDVFYFVKETMSTAEGPDEAVMYFYDAAYAIAGYLRYSTDLRVSADRCDEVLRLGNYCLAQCKAYKHQYKGGLKPKYAPRTLQGALEFYEMLKKELTDAADSMSEEELASLREYRSLHMDDRLDPLASALQNAINSVGMGPRPRGKAMKGLKEDIDTYMKMFLKTGE